MIDITLCLGEHCTKKQTCHRYLTKSESDWQSYISPLGPGGRDRNGAKVEPLEFDGCDMYWPEDDSDG
jgi:hypothetical protein